jgi:uncharacterized membrane protein (DUF373 family)
MGSPSRLLNENMRDILTFPKSPIAAIAHTDVHRALRRYFELAQDFIVASLAIVLLIVMVQGLWVLARLAFVLRSNPPEVLSQIVLLLVLVELFRTLIFYLHEHRVAVPLMLEVAIVSELREILLNQPTTLNAQLYANALLLAVLGSLLLAYRLVRRPDPPAADTV